MTSPTFLRYSPPPNDIRDCFASHRGEKGFFNPWSDRPPNGLGMVLKWQLQRNPWARQKHQKPDLPVQAQALDAFEQLPDGARAMWLGHATVLARIDGVTALIDPIFGRAGGLVPRAVASPLRVDQLPHIDLVLLSHGHRDHFDTRALKALSARFGADLCFVTPLGLDRYLPAGVKSVCLDWWQVITLRGVQVCLVPANHWHQLGPTDRNRALWGGWVLRGSRSLYHTGDTADGPHFKAIRHALGPIDLVCMPMGAYEPRWFMQGQHIAPEDAVRAWSELGAKAMMSMHWGTYDLTDEPLDQGVRELLPAALDRLGLSADKVLTLAHGGSVAFSGELQTVGRLS